MIQAAQQILTLIETVDPADEANLNEIDVLVERFVLDLHDPIERDSSGRRFMMLDGQPVHVREPSKYTRSRDALKAIRPKGWTFKIEDLAPYGYSCDYYHKLYGTQKEPYSSYKIEGKLLPSEELAELHCIIQTIEYEREQS